MKYIIRKGKVEDCKAIANIVTRGWNETYKGIVPDYFLEELKQNENERAARMISNFDENSNNQIVLEVDGKVVGFCTYGKTKDDGIEECGEIFTLYIISEYKGKGFGKRLVECAGQHLKEMGFNKFIVACFKGNPSNDFYKHIGGKFVGGRLFERLNLSENVYLCEDI